MSSQAVSQISPSQKTETVWQSWLQRYGETVTIYVCFIIFALVILFPFYYIFMSSVTPRTELFRTPPQYFPSMVTFENYLAVNESVPFFLYLRNSLIFAVGSSVVSVLFSALAGYALARIRFPGSSIVYLALILSSALPQIAVLVPMFQTLQSFGLVNTHYGLILLMSSLLLPFTILVLVSFIDQVPSEIEEAALIDGANTVQMLTRVVFPLIRPGLATMVMINFIISWNELLYPLVFAQRETTKTLSVGLLELGKEASSYTRPWDMMSALSVVMIIPILLVVLFGQRMIISGLARGAIK